MAVMFDSSTSVSGGAMNRAVIEWGRRPGVGTETPVKRGENSTSVLDF